jgi:vesicular inhibitory amino acid transporter
MEIHMETGAGDGPKEEIDEMEPLLNIPRPVPLKRRHSDKRLSMLSSPLLPVTPASDLFHEEDRAVSEEELCTESQAMYNFLNYMMGAAFMYYPYSMKNAGIFGFLITYSILACISYYTGNCLVAVLNKAKQRTFGDLTESVLGPRWTYVVVVSQYVELFFYIIGYIVMMGDNFGNLVGLSHPMGRFIMVLVTLPTIYLKNAAALSFLSFYSLMTLFLIIGCFLFGEFFQEKHSPINPSPGITWFNPGSIFLVHSGLIAGFSGHAVVPELRGQMKHPEKFGNVFKKVYMILGASYLATTFTGYLTFGPSTESQLTFNFSGWVSIVVNISIMFQSFCRVGLTVFPISLFVEERLAESRQKSWFWPAIFAFRTVIIFAAFFVSLILGSLDVVMTVIGIFCATFFVYILCLLMFNASGLYTNSTQKNMNMGVIVAAAISAALGLYQLFTASQ